MKVSPLERAIVIAGSQAALAERITAAMAELGQPLDTPLRQSHVASWLIDSGKIPAKYCRAAEVAVHRIITRYEFQPDVFGDGPEPLPPMPAAATGAPNAG